MDGVWQSMGSQRVGHDQATELNWIELPGGPCPYAWLWTKVPLFSSGRDCPRPAMNRREQYPFQRLPVPLKMFCKTEDLFTWLPHYYSLSILPFDFSSSLLLSLWSIKEPGIQTPIRWLFWGTSLPSSLSAPFWIKLFSLLQYLISQIHWPVLWRAEWPWTWVTIPEEHSISWMNQSLFTHLLKDILVASKFGHLCIKSL